MIDKEINKPKISVLMPVYNTKSEYLRKAIESVLNQTFTDIELIIINDNSTENVEDVIFSYKDERIIYIKNETNMTAAIVRNRGLEIARGEYISMVDSDDIATPTLLEELYNFLSKNKDYALAVGENEIIDENGIVCYWDIKRNLVYNRNEAFYYSYSDYLMKWATNINFFGDDFGSYQKLLLGNHIPNGYLIRKSIFEKIGFYKKEAPLEDYYIMLQIAKYAKMKFIPKTLFYYRWHSNNASHQTEKVRINGKITRRYEIEIVKKSKNPQIKKHMENYMKSFPKKHFIKIPFIFEVCKQKTLCVEKIILNFLGIDLVIKAKNI